MHSTHIKNLLGVPDLERIDPAVQVVPGNFFKKHYLSLSVQHLSEKGLVMHRCARLKKLYIMLLGTRILHIK